MRHGVGPEFTQLCVSKVCCQLVSCCVMGMLARMGCRCLLLESVAKFCPWLEKCGSENCGCGCEDDVAAVVTVERFVEVAGGCGRGWGVWSAMS